MTQPKKIVLSMFFIAGTVLGTGNLISARPSQDWEANEARKHREIASLERKVDRDSSDFQSLYKIGTLYESLARWQDASGAYQRAVQVKPEFAHASYRLGWCLASLEKYEEALKAHRQALAQAGGESIKPKLTAAAAHYAVGWDYYCLRRHDQSIEAYLQALKLDPQFEDAAYEIGRVLIQQGEGQQVKEVARKLSSFYRDLLLKELSLVVPGYDPPPPIDPKAEYSHQSAPRSWDQSDNTEVFRMTPSLKPTLTYKEKARYTATARDNVIQGSVMISLVFTADGKLARLRIIKNLPYGLTAMAISAMERIRFVPAKIDGQPVSVRGNLEFGFNLY